MFSISSVAEPAFTILPAPSASSLQGASELRGSNLAAGYGSTQYESRTGSRSEMAAVAGALVTCATFAAGSERRRRVARGAGRCAKGFVHAAISKEELLTACKFHVASAEVGGSCTADTLAAEASRSSTSAGGKVAHGIEPVCSRWHMIRPCHPPSRAAGSTRGWLSVSRSRLLGGYSRVGLCTGAKQRALSRCASPPSVIARDGVAFQEAGEVLDSIDEVRQALSKSPKLSARVPSFVVVGMQSVGKSSVLQRIAGIGLPRDANVCTRVPIELRIRRSNAAELKVKVAGRECDGTDHNAVESAILDAQQDILQEEDREFSETSVIVDVESSAHPNLTLIDLPGYFFASDTKNAEETRLEALVKDLIKSKIKQANALILHVAPLNQDSGTINTWAIVSAADEEKQRTVCVLTKADRVEDKAEFVSRLESITKDAREGNRCFLVDGRPEKDEEESLAEAWEWLSGSSLGGKVCVGHKTLQAELEKVLVNHTLKAIPNLKRDLLASDKKFEERLAKIGSRPLERMEALVKGIGKFQFEMRERFNSQLGAMRKATEDMATSVVGVNILELWSMDDTETQSAEEFLDKKCSMDRSFLHKSAVARALQVRCVLERHRGMRNIQFTDNSVLLRHWMPLFTAAVEPMLRDFVKSIFRILKENVAGQALNLLAGKHNGMLQRATEEIVRPRVMDVVKKFEDEAGVFCNDILSWNERQFTSNEHYLQESAQLTQDEEEFFDHLYSREGVLELKPLLVKAASVRGFGKVQAKLLPDALQSHVVLLAHRAVEASLEEVDIWFEAALELVESEPKAIEKQRADLRQQREMLKEALEQVSRIEVQYSSPTSVPSLSDINDVGNEDGEK